MKKNKIKFNYILKVFFVLIVIIGTYVVFNFVKLFSKNTIQIYEVTDGEIVNVDRHRGFIYRDEDVATCHADGYINFYVPNADRVQRGSFIYSINDTPSTFEEFELTENDINVIKQNLKKYMNSITDLDFSKVYLYKEDMDLYIEELNVVKQLEKIDIEKEIDAKEKGYSKYAGIISFIIDGFEKEKIENFTNTTIRDYDGIKISTQKKEVNAGDEIFKIIKNPEFVIAFDSDFDYDNYEKSKSVKVKFVYENITTNGRIESFIGNDGKKHFALKIVDYPEKFLDKRIVEFEIENKEVHGYKVPIKSIVSKNCFIVPKGMLEQDFSSNENTFYKVGENGIKEQVECNISKEDEKYYYISIDDKLSDLKFGDVLINRYNDTYSLNEVVKLNGVYNMNKGYAIFKNVDIIDKTNEYAIIKKNTINGILLYDHIALNAVEMDEGALISQY